MSGRRKSEQPRPFCRKEDGGNDPGGTATRQILQHRWDRGPSGEVKGPRGSGIARQQGGNFPVVTSSLCFSSFTNS